MTCAAGMDARDTSMSRDAIAATAIQLALGFPTWVRRRKWTFSFVDDATIRQQQSVCFRLPAPDDLPLAKVDATILVPLWIARKVPMTNVDMRDEAGRPLSIMSKQENGEASARGLYQILLGLRARAPAPSSGAITPTEDPALLEALRTITTSDPVAATHRDAIGDARRTIAEAGGFGDDERAALIDDLVEGFLVMVPIVYEPGRDRVIKLAFETRHFWRGRGDEIVPQERFSRTLAVTLGLRDKERSIHNIQIGWSLSTHVQVTAPPDVDIGEAWLDITQHDPAAGGLSHVERHHVVYDRPDAEMSVSVLPDWDFAQPGRPKDDADPADPAVVAHRDLMTCRADIADLEIRMGSSTRGVFPALAVLSALTAALLWVAFAFLARLPGQTSAALLLALPAALAAHLARPGEHAFAARMLVGARLTALTVGVCSLVVATLIAVGVTRDDARQARHDLTCKASNRFSVGADGRVPRLRGLECSGAIELRKPPSPRATVTARAVVLGSAALATVLALLLLSGLVRTIAADRRRRNKPDRYLRAH